MGKISSEIKYAILTKGEKMLENFDFSLLENEDFKEDSVREFVISPLLSGLGFAPKNDKKPNPLEMLLSKSKKTQIQIGSNKVLETDLTPDYMLFVNGKAHCILDAKAPNADTSKDSKSYPKGDLWIFISSYLGFNSYLFIKALKYCLRGLR